MGIIRKTFIWILSVLFILFGPIYFFGGMAIAISAKKAKFWPTVSGKILSSKVVQPNGKSASYLPEVRYRYEAAGTPHEGFRIWMLTSSGSESWAKATAAQFPQDTTVTVYYDPSHPAESVLSPGANWYMYFNSILGLALFLVGVFACPARKLLRKKGLVSRQGSESI